ncbi:RINT-1 family protein [Abortiporus biennis]|nr:RINT-1 family protein [Abortiporus biennis]
MASTHIHALLAPPSLQDAENKTLLELDATFPSYNDLRNSGNFQSVVDQAAARNAQLHETLDQSKSEIQLLIQNTRQAASQHLHTAQELSLLRHSISDELDDLSHQLLSSFRESDQQPTLLEDIESLHRSLKDLQHIKGYLQLIQHSLKLSQEATKAINDGSSALDAVPKYKQLQQFVNSVSDTCSQIQGTTPQQSLHLVTFLQSIREKTWHDIKSALTSILLNASEKLGWPQPIEYATCLSQDRRAFETVFLNLLNLQQIGEKLHPTTTSPRSEKDGLYPLQALIQPVALRFKYHFEGTRQTNRLDKPEWYFTHVLNIIHEHQQFMESVVQKLLAKSEYREFNAWREFTLLLFPLLSRKLRRTIPTLVTHPSLLAHTIYQALVFDNAVREEGFELSGTSASVKGTSEQKWEGISEVILGTTEWFNAWMEGERKFAMDQYMEIITSPDAWLIADENDNEDLDEDAPHIDRELKPTISARRVKALVEQVTDRYSPLPQFAQRTKFLITVQLPLLESYHARISASLDAFETLSSTFMRAVPGSLGASGHEGGSSSDPRRLTSGVEGVMRLCKALLSSRYIGAAMEGWGEELFFLELWAEINRKSALRVKAETTATLPDPKKKSDEGELPEGTIFEELVTQYAALSTRADDLIIQSVCSEVEVGLKTHFNSGGSTQNTPDPASFSEQHASDLSVSATLLPPIALLSSHLTFLQSTLPSLTVTSLYRKIASRLSNHILQREITYRGRTRLTPAQGKVIQAEAELWVETCKFALSKGASINVVRAEVPWRKLTEAARIVGSEGDVWKKICEATLGGVNDEDWEQVIVDVVGVSELTREEVGQVLRTRVDFEH